MRLNHTSSLVPVQLGMERLVGVFFAYGNDTYFTEGTWLKTHVDAGHSSSDRHESL
jgi:hypothetical protein